MTDASEDETESAELPHEKHNRIAYDIGKRIIEEFPVFEDKILVLESLVSGTISLITKKVDARKKIFEILSEGIIERLEKP